MDSPYVVDARTLQEMKNTEDTPLLKDSRIRANNDFELTSSRPGEPPPSSASIIHGTESHTYYTVDDALDIIGMSTPQLAILCCMFMGMLAAFAQVLLKTTFSEVFDCDMNLTTSQAAFVSTIFFIGEIASTYPVGRLIDTFGRRMGIIILSANLLYFGLLFTVVPRSYPWVLILRFLAGFFVCGLQSTVACYTGEMAPTKYRSTFMMGLLLSSGLGVFYISTVGLFVVPSLGWRWQAGFASLPSALVLITVLFIPESLRYCALRGDLTRAKHILKNLADHSGKKLPSGGVVLPIIEPETRANFLHLLFPRTRRQTLCVWLIGFSSYFCYYGAALATSHIIQFYSTNLEGANVTFPRDDVISVGHDGDVCDLVHLKGRDCTSSTSFEAYRLTVISSIGDLLASPVAMVMVVLLGRRRAMVITLLLAAVALLCLMFTYLRINPTGFILSIRGLTFGTYGILFLYAVEAYPTYTRAVAITTCQFFAKGAGALTPFVADTYLVENPVKGLIVYASICSVGAISVMLLPFETAGRQLG